MDRGGQPGNNNAGKNKVWSAAINRALEMRSRKDGIDALDSLAEKLLAKCDEADLGALKELGDRLEGKPAQTLEGSKDHPLFPPFDRLVREIVDAKPTNA